jgi:hypothetical protein
MTGSSTVAVHADRDVHPSRAVAAGTEDTADFVADVLAAADAVAGSGTERPR